MDGVATQEKYKLKLPPYPGTSQCVRLSEGKADYGKTGDTKVDPAAIRLNYSLAETSGGLLEADVDADPIKQFDRWFKVTAWHTDWPAWCFEGMKTARLNIIAQLGFRLITAAVCHPDCPRIADCNASSHTFHSPSG